MCAGTVTAPGALMSPGTPSMTSRSRSVALNSSLESRARNKHVGEDRDRRTPLDDARDVAERPQEFTTFNHKPHGCFLGAFLRAKPASLLAE